MFNFFSKAAKNTPVKEREDVVSSIKLEQISRWKEQEATACNHDALFEQMVKEAILTIEEAWKINVRYSSAFKLPVDTITAEAHGVFFISEDLELYSDRAVQPKNDETGRSCFYDVLKFGSQEEVEKYLERVKAGLPEGTTYDKFVTERYKFLEKCTFYTFLLSIDMT